MSKARVINARSFRIRAARAGLFGKQKVMSIVKTTEQFIKRALEAENPLQAEFALGYDHLNDAQLGVEMPMPWGYPEPDWPAAKTGQLEPVTIKEPHTACKSEMNLPVCAPESVQNQQASNSQADLEALLYSLDESGLRVSELKALPSGAMRITVDDLFGNQVREAEFVKVGG
jgi:hypothetical protein